MQKQDFNPEDWNYRGQCGYEKHPVRCQLCGCLKVKYWFRIHHHDGEQRLIVGSECIRTWKDGEQVMQDKSVLMERERWHRLLTQASERSRWLNERQQEFHQRLQERGELSEKVRNIILSTLESRPSPERRNHS